MSKNNMYKIWFKLENDWRGHKTETLWASHIKENEYKLENVPFYARGISYGDIISVNNIEGNLFFHSIVKKSGRSTYRFFLMPGISQKLFNKYWKPLESIGCTYEKATKSLYSVDVSQNTDIYKAYELLSVGEKNGIWEFEEGDCGHKLKN